MKFSKVRDIIKKEYVDTAASTATNIVYTTSPPNFSELGLLPFVLEYTRIGEGVEDNVVNACLIAAISYLENAGLFIFDSRITIRYTESEIYYQTVSQILRNYIAPIRSAEFVNDDETATTAIERFTPERIYLNQAYIASYYYNWIDIRFTTGYTDYTQVPQTVQILLAMVFEHFYQERSYTTDTPMEISSSAMGLLRQLLP